MKLLNSLMIKAMVAAPSIDDLTGNIGQQVNNGVKAIANNIVLPILLALSALAAIVQLVMGGIKVSQHNGEEAKKLFIGAGVCLIIVCSIGLVWANLSASLTA